MPRSRSSSCSPSSPSTSTCTSPCSTPSCSRSRWRSGSPRSCCRRSSRQPGPRRAAHGRGQGHRQAPGLDRELRQHERAVLRQDRARSPRAWSAARRRSTSTASESDEVLLYAYLNATTRPASPTRSTRRSATTGSSTSPATQKLDEVPYDFVRKRLSVLVERRQRAVTGRLMVTKGALEQRARRLHPGGDAGRCARRARDGAARDRAPLRGRYSAQGSARSASPYEELAGRGRSSTRTTSRT